MEEGMSIRRLNVREHGRTRPLYEEVFPEDDRAFVDYYYQWKTKDNIIYVAEDETGIHAMVQLNPFPVSVGGSVCPMHYVVAVATQEKYRRRGLMRRLLSMAEQDARAQGEPFLFLMPAAECIYLPLGYRFFCEQRRGMLPLTERGSEPEIQKNSRVLCRPAKRSEYAALADFANEVLAAEYELFICRDAAYYERLQAEQRCQDGDVMMICRGGSTAQGGIIGVFCTAIEHRREGTVTELREIIVRRKDLETARTALQTYVREHGVCRVAGCMPYLPLEQEEKKPLLMGKALGEDNSFALPQAGRVFINEVV